MARKQLPFRAMITGLLALVLAGRTVEQAQAVDEIPAGSGQVTVQAGSHAIEVFTYKPEAYRDGPLLLVCHGMTRNADSYRDHARPLAERMGAIVAAPLFDLERFPIEAYQFGGIFKAGEVQPADAWTISWVAPIADEMRRRAGKPELRYYLIGHSAGAQFVARLSAMIATDATRIVVANAGSHLFPTRGVAFPHGFGGLPEALSNDAALERYLAQPVTIYLGTADLLDQNLPKNEAAMKQGATRYDRGKNCFRAAQELARKNGWRFNWQLVEAPDVDHNGKAMFEHANAQRALLGP